MVMKQFYIEDFPKFQSYARSIIPRTIDFVEILKTDGFKSAKKAPPGKGWLLSEKDYIFFVLKWL